MYASCMLKVTEQDKFVTARKVGGLAIIALSILLLFWTGYHFKVFGQAADPIRQPEQFLFIACVVLAGFGMGVIGGGPRGGAKSASSVATLMAIAIVIGQLHKLF